MVIPQPYNWKLGNFHLLSGFYARKSLISIFILVILLEEHS